jgi:hypothetical protein
VEVNFGENFFLSFINFGDIEYHSGASEFHSEWWRLIFEMLSIILGLLRIILDGGG